MKRTDLERLRFVLDQVNVKLATRVLKVLTWLECHPEEFEKYRKMGTTCRTLFWKLLATRTAEEAMNDVERVKEISHRASSTGYRFTTKNGLECTVKKLTYAARYKRLMYESFDDKFHAEGYRKQIVPRSFIYLLSKRGQTFGYIVYLVKSYDKHHDDKAFERLKLLRSIIKVYDGQVPAPENHISGFIVGNTVRSMHDPVQKVLSTALALGTTAEIAGLVSK
jgi:hypothetical protein